MSHGSFTDAVNASGHVRWIASWIDSTPGEAVLHRPRPGGLRVGDDLLAGAAVVPRVVQDPVVPGVAAGEDRRVVRERDRRHPGHRAVPVRRARRDEARDVRRLAVGRTRVEHVRVGAVEQEHDDVARRASSPSRTSVRTSPSWPGEVAHRRRAARRRGARRPWARRRRGGPTRGTIPSARTPAPASTNGARAWTTPSDPCSPRWPPASSQLCAAVWTTQRSGAAGWSKSWATCSKAKG